MLVSREELRFNFGQAKFNLMEKKERQVLGWVFNQFLYGEVTGIQCGYWLYKAPSLNSAVFLAKQAGEELAHVRKILRILSLLGEKPGPAHWAVRYLTTGMMGQSWGEHVTLEMALGEGLVLGVFYALADTIPNPEIQKILNQAAVEEERHVEFGERETIRWLATNPRSRSFLLGQAFIQVWFLKRIKNFVIRRMSKEIENPSLQFHPVMSFMDSFYDHSIRCFEMRIERMGLAVIPLKHYSSLRKLGLVLKIPFLSLWARFKFKNPLLTESYLDDQMLRMEEERALSSPTASE